MKVAAFLALCFMSAAYGESLRMLTTDEINAYTLFAQYAAAAFCNLDKIASWNCGVHCEANPTFKPTLVGERGYVGYDPSLKTIILVIHEEYQTGATDISMLPAQTSINPELFPGIVSSVRVHKGLQEEFATIATTCLDAVQRTIKSSGASKVTIVGHYMGGALASLAAVYLPLHLEEVVDIRLITYGQPKVGNRAFADYVDAHINATRITNNMDFIPNEPGEIMGYHHFSGEVHIQNDGGWAACPGQENHSPGCSAGDVHSEFEGNPHDNNGWYNGVLFEYCDI